MIDLRISPKRRRMLGDTFELYSQDLSSEEVAELQLEKFNNLWTKALVKCSFYSYWAEENKLPKKIKSLKELRDFPVLTKSILREHSDLVFSGSNENEFYQTGGTTSEPTKFPAAHFEKEQRFADNYVGRLWWDIHPYERSVLVWGHSHLYGKGISRQVNRIRRATQDKIGGVLRLDGYQQSPEAAKAQLQKIIKFKPSYLVGYTSALVRIARIAEPTEILHAMQLKGIVCTADTLDSKDESLLSRVFGCPIIIEYGAAETGVIAVSRGETRNISVLWDSNLILNSKEAGSLLTTLTDRRFPLINYSLGDSIHPREISAEGSVLSLYSIEGRTDEIVRLRGKAGPIQIGVLQLTHILKGHDSVEAVQYSQEAADRVQIYLKLIDQAFLEEVRSHLLMHLREEYPLVDISSISLIYEPKMIQSRSGKHLVLRPSAQNP